MAAPSSALAVPELFSVVPAGSGCVCLERETQFGAQRLCVARQAAPEDAAGKSCGMTVGAALHPSHER